MFKRDDSSNRQKMNGCPLNTFYEKIWVSFCLNTRKRFFQRFHFKTNRKSIGSSKNGNRYFQNSPPFKRSACFLCGNHWKLWMSSTFYLWNKLSEKWKFFSKNWSKVFELKVTKIENAIFRYNTALPEANVKINGTGSTKWTYYKEWGFANNYFVFLNLFFRLRASYKKLIWCTNYPNVHIHTFCNRWSFIWRYFFPVSIYLWAF